MSFHGLSMVKRLWKETGHKHQKPHSRKSDISHVNTWFAEYFYLRNDFEFRL